MKKVRLGKTNLMVSRIGLGGIPLTRPAEKDAISLVHRSLELGVNFIDTARAYGFSEKRIGKAIHDRRDKVILASKGWGSDKKTALECLHESLRQLNTDYIDLWQVHGINNDGNRLEDIISKGGHLEAALEAKKAGKIRHFGFSSHRLDTACKAVATDFFETVQFPFNFIAPEAREELIPLAEKHDVGFIAMKPFAGGRIRSASLAFQFLLQYDHIMADPGVEKTEQIEELAAIEASGPAPLGIRQKQEIEELKKNIGTKFCRQCEYCMPCPQGVHISGAMYLPVLWEVWPPELYFADDGIGWYIKNAASTAKNCNKCGQCEPKCPYDLPIREMIDEHLEIHRRRVMEYKRDCFPLNKKYEGTE